MTVLPQEPHFLRGDAEVDGDVSIGDAVHILRVLFREAESLCEDACDVTDNGHRSLGDAVVILTYLFRDRAPPPAPFPQCGPDPTADSLTCESYTACPSE